MQNISVLVPRQNLAANGYIHQNLLQHLQLGQAEFLANTKKEV